MSRNVFVLLYKIICITMIKVQELNSESLLISHK